MLRRPSSVSVVLLLLAPPTLRAQQPPAGLELTPLPARAAAEGTRFVKLSAERTGIDFQHRFNEDREHVNVLSNALAGGGVALGDADGDARPDVYLTRSAGGSKLYRNQGELRFVDATDDAGLEDDGVWGSGAAFVDLDGDGDLDLSVCGYRTPNRLYVNDGQGRFLEQGAAAGLAFAGASVTTAWGDLDNDGDLDGYLLTNRINPAEEEDRPVPTRDGRPYVPAELAEMHAVMTRPDGGVSMVAAGQYDHLYRNEGDLRFADVSEEAGIEGAHFGLGVVLWDPDRDGWTDIQVANDFFGPDRLWHNDGDGSFTDVAPAVLPHTPWFSMGCDVGDVDNDGWLDLFNSDMAGTTHAKRHTALGETAEVSWFMEMGAPRQVMRNTLFLNSGAGPFQEAACLAGVEASNWTWSTLFADLDEDGALDLYISNGMTRDYFDSDLRGEAFDRADPSQAVKEFWVHQAPLAEANIAFRQSGELRFEDVAPAWGLDHVGVSFGAALDDLDGDGDLDLVTNDFEAPAGVYENRTAGSARLVVELRGAHGNTSGLGAVVRVTSASGTRQRLVTPVRGYMAASTARAVFGLGDDERVETLVVEWPRGHVQRFGDLPADHRVVVSEPAAPPPGAPGPLLAHPHFATSLGVDSVELAFDDFARQPLLPWRLSRLGPVVVAHDVDGDGHLDFAVGGPAGQPARLFRNVDGQRFAPWPQPGLELDVDHEDMGLVFADLDGDGDDDLFVVSGGGEARAGSRTLRDRLYLNDGEGGLTRAAAEALPDLRDAGGPALAHDADGDGDLDLFVGGRLVPGAWPTSPASRWLRNDGAGRFDDATEAWAPGLLSAGMVTAATLADLDGDGADELVLARSWDTPAVWRRTAAGWEEATAGSGLDGHRGVWGGLVAADLDGDGDVDLALGNLGLNSLYEASAERPLQVWYGDCDGSGSQRIVEAGWDGDRLVPLRNRSDTVEAFPFLAEFVPTFADFAAAGLHDLYPDFLLDEAFGLSVDTLESGVFWNEGDQGFSWAPLPRRAQLAPCAALVAADVDHDGHLDLVMAQNFHGPHSATGRMDGGLGQLLLGDGERGWRVVSPRDSGILVPGDARSVAATDFDGDGWVDLLFGVNSGPLRACYNRRVGGR